MRPHQNRFNPDGGSRFPITDPKQARRFLTVVGIAFGAWFVYLFGSIIYGVITAPNDRSDKLLFMIPLGLALVFFVGAGFVVHGWFTKATRMREAIAAGVIDVTPREGGYLVGAHVFEDAIETSMLRPPGAVLVIRPEALATLKADTHAWALVLNPDDVPELHARRGPRDVLAAIVPLRNAVRASSGRQFAVVTSDDPKFVIETVRTAR